MRQRKKLHITSDRVRKKIEECSFFFRKMEETADNPADEFGFYLSAFLCSMKSIVDLAPLVDRKREKQFRDDIRQLRKNHPSLNYLLEVRDAEVHQEGANIVMGFSTDLKLTERSFNFPSSRFRREYRSRFEPRVTARFGVPAKSSISRSMYNYVWTFRDNTRDVVQTCRESLNALRQQVNLSLGL